MYEKDFKSLIASWENRIRNKNFTEEYSDGVNDCLYELKTLIANLIANLTKH